MKLFFDLHKQGITIIVVTHDPEIGAMLPKTIHIRDGEIEKVTLGGKK